MRLRLFRERDGRLRVTRPIVVAVLSISSAVAVAQQLPDRPDAGNVLQQQREPLRLPPPPPDEIRPKPPEPRPALPVSPTLKVRVNEFKFSGNTLFTDEHLREVVAEFVGKELDFEGLNDAATKVRAFHRERGYFLAQAYLPQQTIRGGVVEIAIIEGRVGEVSLQRRPATRLSEWLLAGILGTHLRTGDIITETGLERPLLLINDLPTAAVTSEIRPSQTIGAADLRVNVDQGVGLLNGFIDFDNQGSRFTGEYRLGGSLNVNNPLSIGDQFTLRAFNTDEGMTFARAAYIVPAGFWGTRVGASYTKFDYQLAKDFASLGAHGKGDVASVFLFHPIYRTRNTNFIGQLAYEDKRLYDRIDSSSTVEDRVIDSLKAGFVGDFRDSVLGGGLNAFSATYTEGNLDIEPQTVLTADQDPTTGPKTAGKFRKWNYEYKRLNRVTDNASVLLAFTGQSASKNLASAERLTLGGANGVRGYPMGEATVDSGWIINAEGRYIIPRFKVLEGDIAAQVFYDWGEGEIREKPLNTDVKNKRSIQSYGFGGSWGKEGNYILRASFAWRADLETPQADKAKRNPHTWIQAVKWF